MRRHHQPQQPSFGTASEQLPNQFYLLDANTGQYRQYSAVSLYSASSGRADGGHPLAPVAAQPDSALAPPASVFPVPIAVGPAAAAGPHHHHHPRDGGGGGDGGVLGAGGHRYLPTDDPAGPGALLDAHPQFEGHHHHSHNYHHHHHLEPHLLPVQPLPSQLHQRLTQQQQQQQPQIHSLHIQSRAVHPFSGPADTMASPGEHDMAAQQEAAKGYQPMLDGPIIGDRTPIAAIVDEYAKADPIYVEKTMALPQTYDQYRPVKGDGNCGWRAIGFSYFEKLVEGGDRDQVEGEVVRLMSMNHYLGTVGGYDYYEDWADEAIGLLRELADCVTDKASAHALIHQRWTDVGTGSALIYYLRLLAATHLKANPEQYDPFVPDGQGIQSYCAQSIELPDREIEQLGIIALYNCLLKSLDFVLEIAYLDRSPGAEVNTYRFPEESNGKDVAELGPMIHLLYRPDHYDILYRRQTSAAPAAANPSPISMQVNRATNVYSHTPITSTHSSLGAFSTADFGLLASLPSAAAPGMSTLSSPSTVHASTSSSCVPESQWMPSLPTHAASDASAERIHQGGLANPEALAAERVASPGSASRATAPLSTSPESECHIRFTKMQYNYQEDSSNSLLGLLPFNVTTTTFKNSVWNRAHFGNPEFRPEQWRPGDESLDDRASTRKKKGPKDA